MTLPGLAMARSIGDHLVTQIGVIAEPEISEHLVGPDDLFLIMATDGVWEFIDSDEAVALVQPIIDKAGATEACTKCARARARAAPRAAPRPRADRPRRAAPRARAVRLCRLIEKAAARWREEEGDYRDDITAIVVKLPCYPLHK